MKIIFKTEAFLRASMMVSFLFMTFISGAQKQPSFKIKEDTIFSKVGENRVCKAIILSNDVEGNFLIGRVAASQLPATEFTDNFSISSISFSNTVKEHIFYVDLHPTIESSYGKLLIYELREATTNNIIDVLYIRLEKPKTELDLGGYRLLVGTNFDFIDGVDALSPYYHLQVFQPKGFSKNFGFIGGIQRNRQVSFSDTTSARGKLNSSNVRFRLSNFQVNDSLFAITQVDSPNFKRTKTTNVFNMYIEPTIKMFSWNEKRATSTSLYLFGHADIVNKRNTYEEEYTYVNPRQMTVPFDSFGRFRAIPEKIKYEENNYEYNYGLGVMLHHDNEAIDIYAKIMVGVATISKGSNYYYYGSEIGIREKSLNIMFGAEYRGTAKYYNPSYLNVYLSKVFTLGKLIDYITGGERK